MHCDIRILDLSVCSLEGLVELAEWRGRELNDFARSIRRWEFCCSMFVAILVMCKFEVSDKKVWCTYTTDDDDTLGIPHS